MSDSTRKCAQCDNQVMETENGLVHVGGGMYLQKCQECGWSGGQVGSYQRCPRCGSGTALVDDHVAR